VAAKQQISLLKSTPHKKWRVIFEHSFFICTFHTLAEKYKINGHRSTKAEKLYHLRSQQAYRKQRYKMPVSAPAMREVLLKITLPAEEISFQFFAHVRQGSACLSLFTSSAISFSRSCLHVLFVHGKKKLLTMHSK
jgi:hypothetical protein